MRQSVWYKTCNAGESNRNRLSEHVLREFRQVASGAERGCLPKVL